MKRINLWQESFLSTALECLGVLFNLQVGTFQQYVSTFVGGFVVAFIKQWKLTLVIVATMPLLVVAITMVSKKLSRLAGRGQEHYAAAGNTVQQVLGSMRTVSSSILMFFFCNICTTLA
jgi:ATP-binding cassette subfamily B (MDR/TAP) protein 1